MTPRGRFRFWVAWLIGGLLAALFWYESLLNSFWGSLAEIFIFGIFISVPLAWFLTKLSKKEWAGNMATAGWLILAAAIFFFLFYASFSVHKQNNFFTGYDLAIFDQAVWHMSRFEMPQSSIRNVLSVFGDHFDPVIALLVPIYGIFPDPRTLLVAQAFLLSAGAGIIWLWAKRGAISPFLAVLLAVLYLTHPGIQGAANCDFHEIAFAPLLLLAIFYFLSRRNWRGFFAAALLLLLVKEEFALWVAAIGLFAVFGEKQVKPGLVAMAMAAVYFAAVMAIFMPIMNYKGAGYVYGGLFPGFENGVLAGISRYAGDPGQLLAVLGQNPDKWWTIGFYVLPLLLPLVFNAWTAILLLPAAATRILSSYIYLSYAGFYYNTVFAALAAVILVYFLQSGSLPRLRARIEAILGQINLSFPILVLAAVFSVNMVFSYGYSYLLDPGFNWRSVNYAEKSQMAELLAQIPADAAVSASYFVLPHLSQRQKLYTLPRLADAQYVIFDDCKRGGCNYWPLGAKNMPEIRDFLTNNPLYRIKVENRAGIVFERTGEIDSAGAAQLTQFCQKMIGQSELETMHRQYMSKNCQIDQIR